LLKYRSDQAGPSATGLARARASTPSRRLSRRAAGQRELRSNASTVEGE